MKKSHSKLALNRDTLRHLDPSAMQEVAGGSALTTKCQSLLCTELSCPAICNLPTRQFDCTNLC